MRRPLIAVPALTSVLAFSGVAVPQEPADAAHPPRVSIALERVGGISYTKVTAKDSDDNASLTAFALGGVTVNPYVAPRLGIDVILDPGVTLGAGLSVARYSLGGTVTTTTT